MYIMIYRYVILKLKTIDYLLIFVSEYKMFLNIFANTKINYIIDCIFILLYLLKHYILFKIQ